MSSARICQLGDRENGERKVFGLENANRSPCGPRSGTFREPTDLRRQDRSENSIGGPLRYLLWQQNNRPIRYLRSTEAPASSSFFLMDSASSLPMFSLTGFGAPSTRSLASLRPRPVISRTVLMTLIFEAPASLRITLNSVFSSASAAAPPAAPPPAAATATGAAETPQRSWRNLPNCAISRMDQDSSSPASLSNFGLSLTSVAMVLLSFYLGR